MLLMKIFSDMWIYQIRNMKWSEGRVIHFATSLSHQHQHPAYATGRILLGRNKTLGTRRQTLLKDS